MLKRFTLKNENSDHLPMTNIQRLNSHEHASISVTSDTRDYETTIFSPIVVEEFRGLQGYYPLLFTKNDDNGSYQPVALFGLQAEENLYIKNSSWVTPNVPLLVKRGPLLIGTENSSSSEAGKNFVAINCDHKTISFTTGERLFNEDGSSTEYLTKMTDTLAQIHRGVKQTVAFVNVLEKNELIIPLTLRIPLVKSKAVELTGLFTIDEEKLQAVSKNTLFELHSHNFLVPSCMMIASLAQVSRLIELKNLQLSQSGES